MKNQMMVMVVGGLALALHVGCAAPSSEPEAASVSEEAPEGSDAVDASALLLITVEPGHTVGFYEPSPGGLYLAERVASGQRFALEGKAASDALAAFAQLRPQAAVPAALQAAYDRARSLPSEPAAQPTHAFGGGQAETAPAATPGVSRQALTSSSSAANFVNNDGGCNGGDEGSFCRVNWGGGFFASRSPTTSGRCIVDHYSGNGVTIQITAGASVTTTFQAASTSVMYSLGTPGAAVTRRIDVLNGSGDSFHAGCNWGN